MTTTSTLSSCSEIDKQCQHCGEQHRLSGDVHQGTEKLATEHPTIADEAVLQTGRICEAKALMNHPNLHRSERTSRFAEMADTSERISNGSAAQTSSNRCLNNSRQDLRPQPWPSAFAANSMAHGRSQRFLTTSQCVKFRPKSTIATIVIGKGNHLTMIRTMRRHTLR